MGRRGLLNKSLQTDNLSLAAEQNEGVQKLLFDVGAVQRKVPFSIGERKMHAMYHWQNISLDDYVITKPVVICLGGNKVSTPQAANGVCHIFKNFLKNGGRLLQDTEGEEPAFIGVSYGAWQNNEMFTSRTQTNEIDTSWLAENEIAEIVKNLLMPLCVTKGGKKLSLNKVCKNFALITFASHCHGAIEVNKILQELQTQMEDAGFTSQEITTCFANLFHIAFAPATPFITCPTFRVLSMEDTVAPIDCRIEKYFSKTQGVQIHLCKNNRVDETTSVMEDSEFDSVRLSACEIIADGEMEVSLATGESKIISDHDLKSVAVDGRGKLLYKNPTQTAKQVSKILSVVMHSVASRVEASLNEGTTCSELFTYLQNCAVITKDMQKHDVKFSASTEDGHVYNILPKI